MSALVGSPTTPLDQVPDLGEGVVEKLSAAGVTTVEGLADMTPEQLEEIPGIGPKTVEKISLAVSNYFSGLEAAAAAAEATPDETAEITAAPDDLGSNPDDAGQSGGSEGLSEVATESSDSVRDLADTGQALEADAVEGVEDAPAASEADSSAVHVHGEEPHEGEK
jgi:N utilization substance protein A